MDKDGFDKSPNHPVRAPKSTKIEIPDNVIKMPGRNIGRIRKFKNDLLDAVLGPEQVHYENEGEDSTESHLDNYIDSSIANSPQSHELNQMLGRNNNDFHEARIISMGKFKEDKANRELMEKNNE